MSLPGQKAQSKWKQQQQSAVDHSSPGNGQQQQFGGKRPESLVMRTAGSKKKGKQLKSEVMTRHSMDVEDRVNPSPLENSPDFRTRSQTLTDLNNMDLQYPASQSGGSYPSGSQSTIASDSRNSAKLIQSSSNPVSHSSNQNIGPPEPGPPSSPIWKPRHGQKKVTVRSPSEGKALESSVFSGSAYGDCSDVVYDSVSKHSIQAVRHPNAYFEHEDTEC